MIILVGAGVFTNGVEWLGKKLNLSDGFMGSILAAVGTALPETMVPIIAIFSGNDGAGHDIGIGAILGAPFMLSTLAFTLSGLTVVVFGSHRNCPAGEMVADENHLIRDIGFFIMVYTMAIVTAFLPGRQIRLVVALFLVVVYGVYVYQTMNNHTTTASSKKLRSIIFYLGKVDPPLWFIVIQILVSLLMIIFGAHYFVDSIQKLATLWEIPAFILALIIVPIATEMPEKFNSVIWLRQTKDTLALGNISGAMVFQSSIVPAIGMVLTDWKLTTGAAISALLTILASLTVYIQVRAKKRLTPKMLLQTGFYYLIFLILVLTGIIT